MQQVVEVEHLTKRYGDYVAVEDVTFSVAEGEIFGILGPNGAGKTTTVECLQGLRHADGGSLSVLGLDPRTHADQLRRRIGSQLQESALPDRIKVWEALDFFASLTPDGLDWVTVMDEWGLAEKRNATFGSLSGGQQQRLFVALALVNNPELVFLDEMTTGLDPASRRVAWDLIRKIRDGGATVVLVTHFMDEAENLCDRIALVDDKRIVAMDTPDGLVATFGGETTVVFSTDRQDLAFLGEVEGVTDVVHRGRRVSVSGTGPLVVRVSAALAANALFPTDLQTKRATLEDVFLEITGGAD